MCKVEAALFQFTNSEKALQDEYGVIGVLLLRVRK